MVRLRWFLLAGAPLVAACVASPVPFAGGRRDSPVSPPRTSSTETDNGSLPSPRASSAETLNASRHSIPACGAGDLVLRFFDVKQGMAVLVELPTSEVVLVDTGESPSRPGCGAPCDDAHAHFMERLGAALGGRAIDVLWLTHPHSDHIGGAQDVLARHLVRMVVHNGETGDGATMRHVLESAASRGVPVVDARVFEPSAVLTLGDTLRVKAVVPTAWPVNCASDVNNCSSGLRVDFCAASVLLVGDAEEREESVFSSAEVSDVDVLQVGHHGSASSSSSSFLAQVKPQWAVISSGARDEGTNRTYCHPRSPVVERLKVALPVDGEMGIAVFEGDSCRGEASRWGTATATTRLRSTSRDGDVVLKSNGVDDFLLQPFEG